METVAKQATFGFYLAEDHIILLRYLEKATLIFYASQ